jgi:hypothetical protein
MASSFWTMAYTVWMNLVEFLVKKPSLSASNSFDSFVLMQYWLTMPALKQRMNVLSVTVWSPSRDGAKKNPAPGLSDRRWAASRGLRSFSESRRSRSVEVGDSGASEWTRYSCCMVHPSVTRSKKRGASPEGGKEKGEGRPSTNLEHEYPLTGALARLESLVSPTRPLDLFSDTLFQVSRVLLDHLLLVDMPAEAALPGDYSGSNAGTPSDGGRHRCIQF